MSINIEHKDISVGEIHSPFQWEVLNVAELSTIVPEGVNDVRKVAFVVDDGTGNPTAYVLTQFTPAIEWKPLVNVVGGGGSVIWGGIGGTVANQTDLVAYLQANFYTQAQINSFMNGYYTTSEIDVIASGKADLVGGLVPASQLPSVDAAPTNGSTNPVQSNGVFDALALKSDTTHNHTGVYEPADATIVKDADIGVTVQAYNVNTVVDASYVHTDNNYTTADQSKLSGIAVGAEVNVQADWNAVAGDALILNKPTSISGYGITDAYTKTELDLALGGKADDATTLAGYNITDAYTKTESDNTFESKNANIQSHISSTANPHGVTAAQVGAYTTAQTDTLLNGKIDESREGIANGIATLDTNAKINLSQIPDSILGQLEYQGVWDMTTLPTPTQKGHYWIASVAGNGYEVGDWAVYNGSTFDKVDNTDAVSSVAGRTGNIVLNKNDVGLSNVDNTSDLGKPVSTATQTALDGKISKVTSTDNAIARYDGVTGQLQNSGVTIDDSGNIELPTISTGVILKSANGTRYKITVDNDGSLTTTAI